MATASDWPTELGTAGSENPAESGADLRRVFLGHKLLLIVATALGTGLGYLKFTREEPTYASSSQVLVARSQVRLPVEGAGPAGGSKDPLATHIELLRTPVILQKAVENLADVDLQVPASPGSIASGLSALRSEESDEIMTLTYRGPNRYDCQKILGAVIAAYIDFVHESQLKLNEKTISLITQAKEELFTSLDRKERDYAVFRDTAALLWDGEEGRNKHQQRVGQIESTLASLQIDKSRIRAEQKAIQEALANGESREALLMMVTNQHQRTAEDPTIKGSASPTNTVAGQLFPLLIEEQTMLERYGPDHPTVQAHRKRIDFIRAYLEGQAAPEDSGARRADLLEIYLSSLTQELAVLEEKEAEYARLAQQEGEAAKAVSADENRNRAIRDDIERTKSLYEVLLEKLQAIDLVKDGDYLAVEMVAAPGVGWQVAPVMSENLAFGGVLGLLAGIALAFLMELSDKSFRGPEQIMKQMGLPVIGHVPTIRSQKTNVNSALDASLVAHHRPRSRLTEAYRAIRVPLLFAAKQDGLKVLQVTSPDPGDGKSTLTANLAIVMANSGKKCLLIDADFRRPRVHKLFGVGNELGLANVIEEQAELTDVIQTCEVDNLDLISCGDRPTNPAELLLSPKFEEALSALREKYDFVLVDTPPVLAVTDPSAVASRVDGVLLVIRITKRVRMHSMRARETLGLIGAKIVGVIVNGIGESNAYAYGTGVYSYRSSQYQYAKSPYGPYQSYGYHDYYAERDPQPAATQQNGQAPPRQPAGNTSSD